VFLSLLFNKYQWNWILLLMLLPFLSIIVADSPNDQNNASKQVPSVFMENTCITSFWVAVKRVLCLCWSSKCLWIQKILKNAIRKKIGYYVTRFTIVFSPPHQQCVVYAGFMWLLWQFNQESCKGPELMGENNKCLYDSMEQYFGQWSLVQTCNENKKK
jgi:hypothetical protein